MIKSIKTRLTAITLIGSVLFSNINTVFASNENEKLNKIIQLGIIQGEGNGINPQEIITRYRGLGIQLKLMNLWNDMDNYDLEGKRTFSDASQQSEFVQKLMAYLRNTPSTKIKGYPDGSFRPHNNMTVHEFATIILAVLGYNNGTDFKWKTVPEFCEKIGLIESSSMISNKFLTIETASEIIYNALVLEGTDEEGNFGEEIGFVALDTRGPQIKFDNFNDVTENMNITLKGSIDEKGSLNINGKTVDIDSDLNFETQITLKNGENKIKTETIDENGNKSEKEFKIKKIEKELSISDIKAESLKMAKVKFSEEIEPSSLNNNNFIINDLKIAKVKLDEKDKTIVKVILDDNSSFEANKEYTFNKIKDIKDINGNILSEYKRVNFSVSDIKPPFIENIINERNNEIKIIFSEPVEKEQAENTANYELNNERFVGNIADYDYDSVILSSLNFKEKNKLKLSNIRNFNNLFIDEYEVEFDYNEDTQPPKIVKASEITLESVNLTFSENINFEQLNKDNFKWSFSLSQSNGHNATDIEKIDNKTVKVYFKNENIMSPGDIYIIAKDVKDISGNKIKNNSNIKIKTFIDETKPELKDVVIEHIPSDLSASNGSINFNLEFSKPVIDADKETNLNDNIIIKDENNNIINKPILLKNEYNEAVQNIEFSVSDLYEGNYKLIIKNLKDNIKYPNLMEEKTFEFIVENKVRPVINGIYFDNENNNNKIYIEYSDEMNNTITDEKNYMINKNGNWVYLSDEIDGNISSLNNNTYAVFSLNENIEEYDSLEVSFVENKSGNILSGNKVSFNLKDENILKNINSNSPVIKYAEITAKNQIKIYLNKEVKDYYYKDFALINKNKENSPEFYADKTADSSIETIELKENDINIDINNNGSINDTVLVSVITINYKEDIFKTDGKFEDNSDILITVNDKNTLYTKDSFGNELFQSSAIAVDKTSSDIISNQKIEFENNLKAVLEFNENLKVDKEFIDYAANDIVITDNNKILSAGIDYKINITENKIEILFTNEIKENLKIKSNDEVKFIKDENKNLINKFENIEIVKK